MALNKRKLRNLAQYRNLSDDEFEEIWNRKYAITEPSEKFEKRIKDKLAELEEDYDLSEMKVNDKAALRALVQAFISLEDYEQILFRIRSEGISETSLSSVDKISKVMSDLRADISRLQNDLNITRKIRKSDQESSVVDFIDSLKEKARKFSESKMQYIFCPRCNTLLGTIWTLYPKCDRNKVVLICNRRGEDGGICGEKVVVSTSDMLLNRGSNKPELMPESML